ncbi:hypothetical protein LLH03_18505 [bacterium]|nr:hypothetical protein [bacterium]
MRAVRVGPGAAQSPKSHLCVLLWCLLALGLGTTICVAADTQVPAPCGGNGWAPPEVTLLSSSLDLGNILPINEEEVVSNAVTGVVVSCGGQVRLGLLLPQGMDRLSLQRVADYKGREVSGPASTDNTLPLKWELRWKGPGGFGPWVKPDLGPVGTSPERALWWLVGQGEPRVFGFELRCRAVPARFLAPGRYAPQCPLSLVAEGKAAQGVRHRKH